MKARDATKIPSFYIRTHETFQYTHFSVCHAPGAKKGFIKGEALKRPSHDKLKLANSSWRVWKTQQHEKVGEKVGENRDKFYFFRQQFANMFANCLSCKGRFRLLKTDSSKPTFKENIKNFRSHLRVRGYPDNLVNKNRNLQTESRHFN